MTQLDGSYECKPAASSHHSASLPNRRPSEISRTRKRLSNFFTSKRRAKDDPDVHNGPSRIILPHAKDDMDVYNGPLRIISPRSTETEPEQEIPAAEKSKRRSFTFKHRQNTRKSKELASKADRTQLTLSEALNEGGHIPVTDAPCLPASSVHRGSVFGLPVRRDSVAMGSAGMPGSPMKEAALTSHPVIQISSESNDVFTMPANGRSVDLGKT